MKAQKNTATLKKAYFLEGFENFMAGIAENPGHTKKLLGYIIAQHSCNQRKRNHPNQKCACYNAQYGFKEALNRRPNLLSAYK